MALCVLMRFFADQYLLFNQKSTEKKPGIITEQYKWFLFVTDALKNFNMN